MSTSNAEPSGNGGSRRLRVLADVDYYYPAQLGGSELALHGVLRWLAGRGHEVRVNVRRQTGRRTIDGVELGSNTLRRRQDLWKWCDVAVTQHACTSSAAAFAREYARPLVIYSHNAGQLDTWRKFIAPGTVVVFNSEAESAHWCDGPSLVVYPPVFADDYRVEPGERVTLVNLSRLKGGPVFWHLADELADVKFLGVHGGWSLPDDRQIVPSMVPANVVVRDPSPNMRAVYGQTRVILLPSTLETFGRVGVEAASSGIPAVANPTPGLVEALGDSAVWVDRDDLDGWVAAVRRLVNDDDEWQERSELARARQEILELTTRAELVELEAIMTEVG